MTFLLKRRSRIRRRPVIKLIATVDVRSGVFERFDGTLRTSRFPVLPSRIRMALILSAVLVLILLFEFTCGHPLRTALSRPTSTTLQKAQ